VKYNCPHLSKIIFGYLDDQSLKQCSEVCTTWSKFLDLKPFYWIRMMKNYIGGQEEFLDGWKRFFYKIPIETAKPFALHIYKLSGLSGLKLCRDCSLEYFDASRSPLHTAITIEPGAHLPFFEYIYEKVMEKIQEITWVGCHFT